MPRHLRLLRRAAEWQVAGDAARAGDQAIWLGYLRSYENMGVVDASCEGACACEQRVDAHFGESRTSITVVQRIVLRLLPEVPGCCTLKLAISNATSSGGHKFKVLSLLLAQAVSTSWRPPGTNVPAAWTMDSMGEYNATDDENEKKFIESERREERKANARKKAEEKNSRKPHVAHCIVGQARGLTRPAVYNSIRTNVVDAFGGLPSIFMVIKASKAQEQTALQRVNSTWYKVLQPTRISVTIGAVSDNAARAALRPQCRASGFETQFAIMSLDGLNCLRLVESVEALRGRRFDVVTKLRPDEQICNPWPSRRRFDWRGHYARRVAAYWREERGVHDHVAIMSRRVAGIYFGSYALLNSYSSPTECVDDRASFRSICNYFGGNRSVWPECLLTRWLIRSKVEFGRMLGPGTICPTLLS